MRTPNATPGITRLWRITNRVTGEDVGVWPGADALVPLAAIVVAVHCPPQV